MIAGNHKTVCWRPLPILPKIALAATATTVLRGLGMDYDESAEIARRPLPPLKVSLPKMPYAGSSSPRASMRGGR